MKPCPVPHALRLIAGMLLLVFLVGCTGGQSVRIPILAQKLPPNSPETPVDFYWTPDSLEGWLRLSANPEKAPDLAAANLVDTHALWENYQEAKPHSKVADLVVSGQIHRKHPREWLLLKLGETARDLGAHGVVVNSYRVAGLTGQASRDDYDALWKGGLTVKVWLYAQAIRYE